MEAMTTEELETKLYELGVATQELLLASELGAKMATADLTEKLKSILDSLKDSNSHITIFRERQIVRRDGTKVKLERQLVDYCFVDDESSEPAHYCEISAAIVVDARLGHPAPQKGDLWVRIGQAPEHEEDDEEIDDSVPPEQPHRHTNEETQTTEEDFGRMLQRMGFDPEKLEKKE